MNITFRLTLLCGLLNGFLWAQDNAPLPIWVDVTHPQSGYLRLELPEQLSPDHDVTDLKVLVLSLDPAWTPDWKKAAFDIKSMIVTLKTKGADVRVAFDGNARVIDALIQHELAAYVDAYVYRDMPYIPDQDATGRLWLWLESDGHPLLNHLLDAASIGVEMVLVQGIDQDHDAFLRAIQDTGTGSLDAQPQSQGMDTEQVRFFFDPAEHRYHVSVYKDPQSRGFLTFKMDDPVIPRFLFPDEHDHQPNKKARRRVELRFPPGQAYHLVELEPVGDKAPAEMIRIIGEKSIDPYELVVKNQVFKDAESQKFTNLTTEEHMNYRYQSPTGAAIDVTFEDTVFYRRDQPTLRVRKALYIGGVKWPYEDLPELPLIQPEKIQSEPLVVDLDKSYRYTYAGEDRLGQHMTWKVQFSPKDQGDFLSGTVWIDQETGAHRKLKAIQSGMEPPVIANEVTAFFDWIDQGDVRFWTQVKEESLLVINILGEAIALQRNIERLSYEYDPVDVQQDVDIAFASDVMILQDTAEGFKYLVKDEGKRVLTDDDFVSKKFIVGGIQLDPALEFPIPLAGFNYSNLDFLGKGYQANLFVAGALNIGHISNTNFLDRGWDLTAELFTTAIYFGDQVYEGDERREDLEVESIRQAFNITLGMPVGHGFKVSTNYSLRYLDYKEGDDLDESFVVPSSTLEHIGRLDLQFDRHGFSTALQGEAVKRTDWAEWGLPGTEEEVQDAYRSIRFDMGFNHKLPRFQNVGADIRYLKGWNLDRFSRFGFGFFENPVSGFGTSGVEGDEALRIRFGYDIGVKGLFQINTSLDAARAWRDQAGIEPVDIIGFGTAVNFVGPWKTLVRINVGYGLDATLDDEAGDVSGQILFLRLY